MSAFGRRKSSIMARVKASECKCCECGKPAVAFYPVIDPDIPSYPYCPACLEKAMIEMAKVVWKECRTAVFCGLTLAAACFCKIMLVDRMLMGNPDVTIPVALTVCVTMASTVLIAKIIGCTLPMIAKRIGFDPAVMASPFITTIVDALSLLVYFGIATAVLF